MNAAQVKIIRELFSLDTTLETKLYSCGNKNHIYLGKPAVDRRLKVPTISLLDDPPRVPIHDFSSGHTIIPFGYMELPSFADITFTEDDLHRKHVVYSHSGPFHVVLRYVILVLL